MQADNKSCYIGICNFLKSLRIVFKISGKERYVACKLPCTLAAEGIWRGSPLLEQIPVNTIADGPTKNQNLEKVVKCALTRSHELADNEYVQLDHQQEVGDM